MSSLNCNLIALNSSSNLSNALPMTLKSCDITLPTKVLRNKLNKSLIGLKTFTRPFPNNVYKVLICTVNSLKKAPSNKKGAPKSCNTPPRNPPLLSNIFLKPSLSKELLVPIPSAILEKKPCSLFLSDSSFFCCSSNIDFGESSPKAAARRLKPASCDNLFSFKPFTTS